jgi:MoaA/NifB/PqqE/SkfB family radical SAM enzyme
MNGIRDEEVDARFTAAFEEGFESATAPLPGFGHFIAPKSLVWELTGRCELHCPFCFGSYPQRFDQELSGEEKRSLAKELVDARLFGINLSGGEPFLCEDLPDLVAIFREGDIPVNIVTSGFHLTEEVARRILRHHEVAFCFSLDAPNEPLHDELRGRTGAFRRALESMALVKSIASPAGASGGQDLHAPALLVECVVCNRNLERVEEMIPFCEELGVVHLRIQPMVNVGRGGTASALALSARELQSLQTRVLAARKKMYAEVAAGRKPAHMQITYVDQSTQVVHGLQTGRNAGGIILPDGTLKVSAYLPYTFGNIREGGGFMACWRKGFKGAWKHPEIRRAIGNIKSTLDLEALARSGDYQPHALSLSDVLL